MLKITVTGNLTNDVELRSHEDGKPDIEARARENMSAGGGDQKSEDAKSGLTTLSDPISPVSTRKELAEAVGIGEVTMGKVRYLCPPA